MSVEHALLQDVLDHPHDDTPLLVLADWLMEQDDPVTGPLRRARGEFIRLQVLLANTPLTDPGRPTLKTRERQLQERFERLWMAELGEEAFDWSFHRGLIGLWLNRWSFAQVERIATDSQWMYVCGLHLEGGSGEEVVRLLDSPYLERLTWLALPANSITDAEVRILARVPALARLRSLDLAHNHIGGDGVRALVHSPHLQQLSSLCLSNNPLPRESRAALRKRFAFRVKMDR